MNVSCLQVMESAAGFYVGREYFDVELGLDLPYSRESEYMTKTTAVKHLAYMQKDEE